MSASPLLDRSRLCFLKWKLKVSKFLLKTPTLTKPCKSQLGAKTASTFLVSTSKTSFQWSTTWVTTTGNAQFVSKTQGSWWSTNTCWVCWTTTKKTAKFLRLWLFSETEGESAWWLQSNKIWLNNDSLDFICCLMEVITFLFDERTNRRIPSDRLQPQFQSQSAQRLQKQDYRLSRLSKVDPG